MITFIYTVTSFIANFIAFYAIGVFVSLEPNVLLWSEPGRAFLIFTAMVSTFLEVMAHFMIKEQV